MPRSRSADIAPQTFGVPRVNVAPAAASAALTGVTPGGTGSKAQTSLPLRTSKARTTPGGASTRCPSCTKAPVTTRLPSTSGAEVT